MYGIEYLQKNRPKVHGKVKVQSRFAQHNIHVVPLKRPIENTHQTNQVTPNSLPLNYESATNQKNSKNSNLTKPPRESNLKTAK